MGAERVEQGAPPRGDARSRQLLAVFQRMRRRPTFRTGDRLRPLLLVADGAVWRDGRDGVAKQLVDACREDGGLYARIEPHHAGREVSELLREISHQLSESGPRLEPALRFPLLSMTLWLLALRDKRLKLPDNGVIPAHPPHEDDDWELAARLRGLPAGGEFRRRALVAGIRHHRQRVLPARGGRRGADRDKLASLLSYLEQAAPIGVAVVALISATAASTLDLAAAVMTALAGAVMITGQAGIFTWDRAGRRRYRWFSQQPYGWYPPLGPHRPRGGFPAFAVQLFNRPAPPAPRDDDPPGPGAHEQDLEKLLIAAFLEDLRQSYRRSWRRVTWARVRYPTLILDADSDPGADGPGPAADGLTERFVELVEQVRRERLAWAVSAEPPTERDRQRPERAARQTAFDPLVIVACLGTPAQAGRLAERTRVRPAGGEPVDLGGVEQAWWDYWDDRRPAIAFGYVRDLSVDLTAGDGALAGEVPRRRRPWIAHPFMPWLVAGTVLVASVSLIALEAVRYCDPHSVWRERNGECVGITDGSYVFSPRLKAVQDRIEGLNKEVAGSGKPYVTIVYLGPMTVDPSTRNPQADLQAGIHGELVGMAIAQQRHNAAGGQPRLRILLANSGSRFRYAGEVAERIRDRAVRDRTIVGVVGFGHSRRQTQTAINVLSQAALPMVGTTNTYDDTARQRGGYSPYYFRLAPPNRRLAAHGAHWARTGKLGRPAKTADVFYDAAPDDLYSGNLAQDFAEEFGRDKVRLLPYSDPAQVPSKVLEACTKPSDVFYYAGRSDEFRSFINRLANTSCGGRRIVLAGDEVTKYVSDNGAEVGRTDSIRLFFTPLAAREAWDPAWVGEEPLQVFYADFDPTVAELVGHDAPANERPSRTHAAIGYDAALTIISVAERSYGDQGRALPTAAAVLAALTEPDEGALPQGASGLLRFGPRSTGHQVPDKPVLLVTLRPDGAPQVVSVCGRLSAAAQQTRDCPR